MDMKDETYFQREARRISDLENHIRDNYNTLTEQSSEHDFKRVVNANIDYAPHNNETFTQYHSRVSIYARIARDKNSKTHILNGKKIWYTHRNPMGCFMCEDANLIQMLVDVIGYIASETPDKHFTA